MEEWRDIPGWEGYYQASSLGKIRSVDRVIVQSNGSTREFAGRVLKLHEDRNGYIKVLLHRGKRKKNDYVHRLVMIAFKGPCPDGHEVCHNDGSRSNNCVANLRYGTRSENILEKQAHGTDFQRNKTHCPRGHLHCDKNNEKWSLKLGHDSCLSCSKARSISRGKDWTEETFQKESDKIYKAIMESAN